MGTARRRYPLRRVGLKNPGCRWLSPHGAAPGVFKYPAVEPLRSSQRSLPASSSPFLLLALHLWSSAPISMPASSAWPCPRFLPRATCRSPSHGVWLRLSAVLPLCSCPCRWSSSGRRTRESHLPGSRSLLPRLHGARPGLGPFAGCCVVPLLTLEAPAACSHGARASPARPAACLCRTRPSPLPSSWISLCRPSICQLGFSSAILQGRAMEPPYTRLSARPPSSSLTSPSPPWHAARPPASSSYWPSFPAPMVRACSSQQLDIHQVRDKKNSNIPRDSNSIRQNYSIKEKIFSN